LFARLIAITSLVFTLLILATSFLTSVLFVLVGRGGIFVLIPRSGTFAILPLLAFLLLTGGY